MKREQVIGLDKRFLWHPYTPMQAYLEQGEPLVIERAEGAHLHVSFDVDSMDPSIAPGTGTPVPGGLTYREGHLIMEMLHDSDLVASLDIVEVNPYLDRAGETARLAVALISSLFGRKIMARGSVFDQPDLAALAARPARR